MAAYWRNPEVYRESRLKSYRRQQGRESREVKKKIFPERCKFAEEAMGETRTDEEFLARLRQSAPELLEAEIDFDAHVIRMLPLKRTQKKKHNY